MRSATVSLLLDRDKVNEAAVKKHDRMVGEQGEEVHIKPITGTDLAASASISAGFFAQVGLTILAGGFETQS